MPERADSSRPYLYLPIFCTHNVNPLFVLFIYLWYSRGCAPACGETPDPCQVPSSVTLTSLLETESLTEPGAHLFSLTG